MEQFVSQDPRSYSLYFDLKIWFRARKVTGTFEKQAPGLRIAPACNPLGTSVQSFPHFHKFFQGWVGSVDFKVMCLELSV